MTTATTIEQISFRARVQKLFTSDLRVSFVAWVIGATVFFRKSFFSGFDQLSGDFGDMRLVSLLHEHWFNVLRLRASWNNPNFFFPQKHVLGYSDTFFLNQLFYIPLRSLGFDRYAALQWTLILLSGVGFVGLYRYLGTKTTLPRWVRLAITESTVFANAMAVKIVHPQMGFVYWLPWILILLDRRRSVENKRQTFANSAAAGLLYGLVVYSGYYVGWFAGFVAGLFGCWYLIVSQRWRGLRRRADWQDFWARYGRRIVGFVAGLAIGLIPFAYTYGPIANSVPKKPWFEPMLFAANPRDLVNLGPANDLWGGVMRSIYGSEYLRLRYGIGEVILAVTPFVLLAVMFSFSVAIREWRSGRRTTRVDALMALVVTFATVRLISMKIGTKSLWYLPYRLVPGAGALRAIDRIQIVNLFVAALAIALACDIVWSQTFSNPPVGAPKATNRSWLKRGFAVVLIVGVFEQVNADHLSTLDRSNELALFVKVPNPPKECKAFFVNDESHPRLEIVNIDAMVISQSKHLPTVNGYSGQFPKDYFPDSVRPDYLERIKDWSTVKHSIAGLCRLDRPNWIWSTQPFP